MNQKYLVTQRRLVGAMNRAFTRGIAAGLFLASILVTGLVDSATMLKLWCGGVALLVAAAIAQKAEEKSCEE